MHILPVPGLAQTPGGPHHSVRLSSTLLATAAMGGAWGARKKGSSTPLTLCLCRGGGLPGVGCESEQRAASPARLHLDVCWLWLAFVPWPRRSRLKGTWRVQVRSGVWSPQFQLGCWDPGLLTGVGLGLVFCPFLRLVRQKRAPELALSLFCLLLCQCSVPPPHDKKAPCHPRAMARRTGHPERLRCRLGS